MPSAESAKLEKQASSNQAESTTDNNNANTPIRQALVIIEHKIRNLEKRKTKLETYRAIQSSGKELSSDQKTAVSKYDEVAQSLEFARELSKQMAQLATMADKEQRKQARREAIVRAQSETAKIREVLTIQNILSQFENSIVRDDFLNGTNGAIKLEESDLQVLEKFYIDIQVTRQNFPEDTPFSVSTQKAAEYLSLTIDGRPKSYGDTTFENIRRILQNIQECGYLDKGGKIDGAEEFQDEPESDQATTENEDKLQTDLNFTPNEQANETDVDIVNPNIQSQQQQILSSVQGNVGQNLPKFSTEAPSAAAVPAPAFPQQLQSAQSNLVNTQIQSQPPQLQRQVVSGSIAASVAQVPAGNVGPSPTNPLHAAHFPPTTVRAVEQAYFKQHQYIQQMRPLAEVIGTGNFYFLQDSELDSPDLVPSGFTPNETQNPAPNIAAGNLPPQSPNSVPPLQGQNVLAQQQQPQMPPQPNSSIQAQQKAQQQPTAAPIPTQTFTNQSFPPIVPPTAIFPQDIPTSPSQIPVFTATPIPIPQLVAQPAAVIVPQTVPVTLTCVDGQQVIQQNSVLAQQNQNPQNLITGPSGVNVALPGFSSAAKFQGNPPLGIHQANNQMPPIADQYEPIQPQSQVVTNESGVPHRADEIKDRTQDATNEWDAHEASQKTSGMATSNTKEVLESNQWSNEVAATTKNDWNNSFDNQNESNTWNSNQNDSYGNRNNRNYGGNRANSGGGNGGGGTRGIRGGNTGSSASNGYRGRSNNSYQQQNGRNNVYFRNNDNGYYQNQNGGYNNAGNKQDSGTSYGNNANNSSYRGRSGPGGGSMSQGGPRQQTGNRPGNRPGRNNGNSAGTYGSSRPPNTVRQQQDVNA